MLNFVTCLSRQMKFGINDDAKCVIKRDEIEDLSR